MRAGALALVLVACSSTVETPPADGRGEVRVGGSETLMSALLPALAKTHDTEKGSLRFSMESTDSAKGIRALLDGRVQVAASTRRHTGAEQEQAKENGYSLEGDARTIVGVDVLAVAVNPANPAQSMTYDQVIGIFCTGSVDNWAFLGQDDRPIKPVAMEPGSGTRALFEDFFCGPRGFHQRVKGATIADLEQQLGSDKDMITFRSLSLRVGKTLPLRPDASSPAIKPTQANIVSGAYPLYRDLYLYTAGAPKGDAADFLAWIASPAGQDVVDNQGFVPLFLRPERLDEARPLRETIHFDPGATTPNPRSRARLALLVDELGQRIQNDGDYRHIVLEGFSDNQESNGLALSEQRAVAVRALLDEELSTQDLFFEIIPRGAKSPLAPNDTPYGRTRNRRVQIYLAAEERQVADPPKEP